MDREITTREMLLDDRGRLRTSGWARDALVEYNKESLRSRRGLSEWELYHIFNREFSLTVTYGHGGSRGFASACLTDLVSGEVVTFGRDITRPGDMLDLDHSSGSAHNLKREEGSFFLSIDFDGEVRTLRLRDNSLHAELSVHDRGQPLITVTPYASPRRFALSYRKTFLDLAGHLSFRNRDYTLDNDTFMTLWSVRGVLPGNNRWVQCYGTGEVGGRVVGLQLFQEDGEKDGPTECALFDNGEVVKLGELRCRMNDEKGLKTLYISDASGRLHLTFEPEIEDYVNHIHLLWSQKKRRLFGMVSGSVINGAGEKVLLQNMPFYMEKAGHRW